MTQNLLPCAVEAVAGGIDPNILKYSRPSIAADFSRLLPNLFAMTELVVLIDEQLIHPYSSL